ncbi:MAG: dihydrodipicolinate synthase family protein [Chloroflexi bacterium]|nr:dihydrodipicolinate synthase family protein [Chloroflexota bacterium]
MTFDGVYPPIATPFDEHGRLDVHALAANIRKWNETGLRGYVVAGSNGESALLEHDEIVEAVSVVRRTARPDMRVIAGTGRESTEATIRLSRAAADAGADAVLIITPSFFSGSMTPTALVRHYRAVADASPVPVIVYNVPKFTNLNLSAETVAQMATHDNIIGIKDSAGNIGQIIDILRLCPAEFRVFAGNSPVFLSALQMGAAGGILALANVAPRECVAIYNLAKEGRYAEAREIHFRLMPVGWAVTTGYGVPGLKAALDWIGFHGGAPRPPVLPADERTRQAVGAILTEAGLLNTPG